MQIRKITALLLSCLLLASALSLASAAVEPSYDVSDAYKDTLYYNNLQAITLTGDGATDTIAVALSQLGYHEGNNDSQKDGLNGSGSKNFVEYNVLFGKLDNGEGNGVSYGYAWCAAFVNWSLRQARVDLELTGGMYVSCAAWRNWFIYEGEAQGASYHARTDNYTPKKGDLIFFKSLTATHSRPTDHIGIVLKCEDGKVYTIEGNGDNRVALHSYALNDAYIVGYGSIAYKTADVPEVDYYRREDHLPGTFVAGKGIISLYQGPSSTAEKVGSLTAGAVYRVLAVQGNFGYVTTEQGKSGWVSIRRFTPITTDPYYTVTLQNGEQTHEIRIAQGQGCTLPDPALLVDELGETPDFLCWGNEQGAAYAPGQVLTPESDLVLYAMSELPEATEPLPEEMESTEAKTGETEAKTGETEATTESEQTTAQQKSEGCGSVLGVSAVLLPALALPMLRKKKKQA